MFRVARIHKFFQHNATNQEHTSRPWAHDQLCASHAAASRASPRQAASARITSEIAYVSVYRHYQSDSSSRTSDRPMLANRLHASEFWQDCNHISKKVRIGVHLQTPPEPVTSWPNCGWGAFSRNAAQYCKHVYGGGLGGGLQIGFDLFPDYCVKERVGANPVWV